MENNLNAPERNSTKGINFSFDEFEISEESFKPVTKGLGFHQEQKRVSTSVKLVQKEISKAPTHSLLNEISKPNKETVKNTIPTGLEAFYGTKGTPKQVSALSENEIDLIVDKKIIEENKYSLASGVSQLTAWLIDLALVASFSAITTVVLILVSGMSFQSFLKVVPMVDLITFSSVLFSIYYLLYFTILELNVSPGKTILGIRLMRTDDQEVSVKNTFIRALVSLLSFVALFLPMVIDFQGRLSDTKVVK